MDLKKSLRKAVAVVAACAILTAVVGCLVHWRYESKLEQALSSGRFGPVDDLRDPVATKNTQLAVLAAGSIVVLVVAMVVIKRTLWALTAVGVYLILASLYRLLGHLLYELKMAQALDTYVPPGVSIGLRTYEGMSWGSQFASLTVGCAVLLLAVLWMRGRGKGKTPLCASASVTPGEGSIV